MTHAALVLPTENLIRSLPEFALRADADADAMPTLYGHAAVFNEWTEIRSYWEGHFLERIMPGAFTKTIQEQADAIRVLFDHGFDPVFGDRPLGKLEKLAEDQRGLYYEAPLFDTPSIRGELLPGLRSGQYGASFRFWVVKEEFNNDPGTSAHNPQGLPERSVLEAGVREIGPCTFGAYPGADAAVRSLSDAFRSRTRQSGEPQPGPAEPPEGTRQATPMTGDQARELLERRARIAQIRKDAR